MLAKHISCKCECKFDDRNVTSIKSRTISVGVSVKIQKNIVCVKKVIFGTLQHLELSKNGNYAESIAVSVVVCNEVMDETKSTLRKTFQAQDT